MIIMNHRIALSFSVLLVSAQAQYPNAGIDHEEQFQSAEPISIFARSRVIRGGGYGSAPVEILPVQGPSYSNQQIDSLPNYGGAQIAPIKEEPYSGGGGGYGGGTPIKQEPYGGGPALKPVGGYGSGAAPIKKEPYNAGYEGEIAPVKPTGYGGAPGYGGSGLPPKTPPGYGGSGLPPKTPPGYGGSGLPPKTPPGYGGSGLPPKTPPGYGGSGLPPKTPPGYGGSGLPPKTPPGYGGSGLPPKTPPGYGGSGLPPKTPPGYGGSGLPPSAPFKEDFGAPSYGHKQPSNYGYTSGSGISFGQSGSYGSPQHQQPGGWGSPSSYGGQGQGGGFQQKEPGFNQPAYGSASASSSAIAHDSYSKPPVIQNGYGQPLAPPAQGPAGYGR